MESDSSQFSFDDFTRARQAQFDAMILPGELQNQIETDFNEIHAMYPFLPVDPPILKSVLLTATTNPTVISVPDSAKLMRITNTGPNAAYTTNGGAVSDNSDGVGWVVLPSQIRTTWMYCGHTMQVSIAALSGTPRVSVEFAGMHARIK